VSAIQAQPGPMMFSDAVAPLAACTVPKSIRSPGVGRPSLGRSCTGTSTSWGDSWVPGAICVPDGSVAGAVVITNDIRSTACPGFTFVRSASTGLAMSSLATDCSSGMGAAPSGTSAADMVAVPARSVGCMGVPWPSTSPNVRPLST
jgi:hypothetical protein